MILEKETFKKFGYHSYNLSKCSHKKIIRKCDGCGRLQEIPKKNFQSLLCQSCSNKGENNPFYGKTHTKEVREKSRIRNIGHRHSDETKQKMSESRRGENNWCYGKHFTEEHKQKISKSHMGLHAGNKNPMYGKVMDKSPNWKGGISFEEYPKEFHLMREQILKIYGGKCILCGRVKSDDDQALDIHHINQNKKDNSVYNLVPMCRQCHAQSHNLVSQISLTNQLSYFLMYKEWENHKDEC